MEITKIIIQILLAQIPEAIFFSIFMILTKELKENRILFTFLMTMAYLILKIFIHYSIWFHILYIFNVFIILKILYKDKAQITDIFTFGIASIILMITSAISYFVFKNYIIIALIVNRIFIFLFLFLFRNKLNKIQKMYQKLWNRNDGIKKKMKSTTFRCTNLGAFNFMFYIMYLGITFLLIKK